MENISEPVCDSTGGQPTFVAGGPVQAANGVYLTRTADRRLLELCLSKTFAYVLTSRQMGKSSLMVRTAEALERQGSRFVIIDLTEFGSWLSAEQWYGGIVESIANQLEIAGWREWWQLHGGLGMAQRFSSFVREVVLNAISDPVVIFVDEIDSTLSLAFSDDFFAAIRFLYHMRVSSPALNRLSFVLIGVASPDELMKDASRTPFNIGQRVDLADFTEEEAFPLVEKLNLSPIEATLFLHWVLGWTGGHPYLTLRVFRKFQEDNLNWITDDAVIRQLYFGKGESPDSNLEFIRKMIVRDDAIRHGVLTTYEAICHGQVLRDESTAVKTRLKLSGLVVATGGELRVRNRIYEQVFDRAWVELVRGELKKRKAEPASPARAGEETAGTAGEEVPQATGKPRSKRWKALLLTRDHLERSILLATESLQRDGSLEAFQFLRQNLSMLRRPILRIEHAQRATSAAFSPDGQYAGSASQDGTARIFEISTGLEVGAVRHPDRIWGIAFHPDGKTFATAGWDGAARIWSIRGGRLIAEALHDDCVTAAVFTPDGSNLVTISWDNSARVWDIRAALREAHSAARVTLAERRIFLHDDRVSGLALTPDGEILATASWDRTARLWNLRTGTDLGTFSHESRVVCVALSPNGRTLATAIDDRTAAIWSVRTKSRVAELRHDGRVTSVVINGDGTLVATASEDRTARTWSLATGEELTRMQHFGRVSGVAFGGDDLLITASEDATARIWSARTGGELARLAHEGRVVCGGFTTDAALAISACEDRSVRIWDVAMAPDVRLYAHSDRIRAIALSPDGTRLASAGDDGTARVWTTQGEQLRMSHPAAVTCAAFSADGRLLTASEDAHLYLWDRRGRKVKQLPHPSWVYCAMFHADNKHVLSGCEDGVVRVWDVADGIEVHSWAHAGRVWAVAGDAAGAIVGSAGADGQVRLLSAADYQPLWQFHSDEPMYCLAVSPDGSQVAGGDAVGRIRIWQVEDGRLTRELPGANGAYSLGFSPDGRFLIAGFGDGRVTIWELDTGRETVHWDEAGRVYGVAFYPDGKLAAVAANNEVRVLPWMSEDVVAFVRGHLTRNLSKDEWNEYFEGEPYRKTSPQLP